MNNNIKYNLSQSPMTAARELLGAIWANDAVHQITTIKGNSVQNHPVENIDDALEKSINFDATGHNVFFACAGFETEQNRTVANAKGANGFWLDIDCGEAKAANNQGYATKNNARDALSAFLNATGLPNPSHWVDSGNGLHVYFITPTLIAATAWKETANKLKALCNHHDLLADPTRTADLASVLRLPDTHNYKDSNNPKLVQLKKSSPLIETKTLIDCIDSAYLAILPTLPQAPSNKVVSLFGTEKLGATKVYDKYEDTTENRKKFLSAALAAYPEGIPSRESYCELGMSCAALVKIHGWPENVAREILEEVASIPEDANRENNDKEWESYLKGTQERSSRGEPTLGVKSVFDKARGNGWKDPDHESPYVNGFALIQLGGTVNIINESQAITASTKHPLSILNQEGGALLIKRQIKELNPKADVNKVFNDWKLSPNTTVYKGVELNPSGTTNGYLNLWRGLSVTPHEGDYRLIRSFIHEVICDNNQDLFAYVWSWLAHAVQFPEEKPGVSLLLLGGQGIGKGMFAANIVGALYADHFVHLQSDTSITGNFNSCLESSFIVFADEAFFSGDKKSANVLKGLETESSIEINAKFQPSRQITSYHRIISASNNEHAAYVETDDRRKVALRVSEKYKGNHQYWKSLVHQIKNGGLEALAYALQQTDISDFQVRNKPNTNELLKQKLASLDSVSLWWVDRLTMGSQRIDGTAWDGFVGSISLHEDFAEFHKTQYARGRTPSIGELVNKLKTICPSITATRQGGAYSRKNGLKFPQLELARNEFEKYLGGPLSW